MKHMRALKNAALVAGVGWGAVATLTAVALGKKALELKNDNLALLYNALEILGSVDASSVPEEVLYDIEFRRMAAVTEMEQFGKKDK